jgi:hypothetical protein
MKTFSGFASARTVARRMDVRMVVVVFMVCVGRGRGLMNDDCRSGFAKATPGQVLDFGFWIGRGGVEPK